MKCSREVHRILASRLILYSFSECENVLTFSSTSHVNALSVHIQINTIAYKLIQFCVVFLTFKMQCINYESSCLLHHTPQLQSLMTMWSSLFKWIKTGSCTGKLAFIMSLTSWSLQSHSLIKTHMVEIKNKCYSFQICINLKIFCTSPWNISFH